jgi:hypothetical protein
MKTVADKLGEKENGAAAVAEFKAKANVFAKSIIANFKNYEFVGQANF